MASGVPGMGAETSLKPGDPIKAGDLRTRQAAVLFREAKERGIGCESCRKDTGVSRIEDWCENKSPGFFCNGWEAGE